MPRTKKGEKVFSYAFGEIKAIGKIAGSCIDARRPDAFGETGEQWSQDGWLVPVEWTVLSNPLSPRAHWSKMALLLPKKYSPIRAPGIGNQKFYLTEINEALAEVLLKLIRQNNPRLEQ
ncbi:MAG TPA: hypothetical protein VK557_12740 [Pyrinomonadaceae bacterium]|nr:hypothetical protein [Pyrinomonadaceae bacterium]